jgi:hypothetical protein
MELIMNFLIKIENGKPINHPIAEENLKVFYPDLNVNNPPQGYARFVRKPLPEIGLYQTISSSQYDIDDVLSKEYNTTVWTDYYEVKSLSEEQLLEIAIKNVRDFNENMRKTMNAPYAAPDDGNYYIWSVSSNKWVLKPDNFEELATKFYEKMKELNLLDIKPEDFDKIDKQKLIELENIFSQFEVNK